MKNGHIADDRWMDVLEGDAAASERSHLEACASCRGALDEVRGGVALARDAEVPEPSPLFWTSFKKHLDARIVRRRAVSVSRWGMAAAALLLVGLSTFLLSPPAPRPPQTVAAVLPAWWALPEEGDDAALPLIEALDPGDELATTVCGEVAACVVGLTEEEGERVAQALALELKGRSL